MKFVGHRHSPYLFHKGISISKGMRTYLTMRCGGQKLPIDWILFSFISKHLKVGAGGHKVID